MELIPGLPDDIARECLIRVTHRDFPRIAKTCKDWRAEIHCPEFSRLRRAVGSSQTLLVFAQARVQPEKEAGAKFLAAPTYRLTAYSPDSGEWSELGGEGERLPMFSQIVAVGSSELMVIGGWDPVTWTATNKVFVYDFVTAMWRRGKDIPGGARSFFAVAAAPPESGDRRVFVAGGHDERKNALRTAMAYDLASDQWSEMPEMAAERDECKGIFRNGRFCVVGGYATAAQGRFGRSAEEFDLAEWKWRPVEDDFLAKESCPRTCVSDREVFVCCGGELAVRDGGGEWRAVAELPGEVREAACAVAWRGKVVVIGSERFGGAHAAFALDIARRSWTRIAVPEEFTGHVQSGCCLEL